MNALVKLAQVNQQLGVPDLSMAPFMSAMNKAASVGSVLKAIAPYAAGTALGGAGMYGLSRLLDDDGLDLSASGLAEDDPTMEAALLAGLRRKAMVDRAQRLHGMLLGQELPQPTQEQQLSRFR